MRGRGPSSFHFARPASGAAGFDFGPERGPLAAAAVFGAAAGAVVAGAAAVIRLRDVVVLLAAAGFAAGLVAAFVTVDSSG